MKFLSLMVVIISVIQTLRCNASKQHQSLEIDQGRKKMLAPILEDIKLTAKRATHNISPNSTLLDKILQPIPNGRLHSQIPRISKGRAHLGHRRMREHNLDSKSRDELSYSTKVYRRHRNKKVNLSRSGKNDKPNFSNSDTYGNKTRSNRTFSCCNKNNKASEAKHYIANTQNYKQIDPQSSIKPTVYSPASKHTVKLTTVVLDNDFSNTTQAAFKSYATPFTTSAKSLSSARSATLSLTTSITLHTTHSKSEKFEGPYEVVLASPSSQPNDDGSSGLSSKLQLATVLSVISAMLLMPFLALWLSAVKSAARERVNNNYDDQELLLATHV